MSPCISIIVPCYNQAEYLDECLQSVLEQSFQDWECIIVNDGSTDNSEAIAQQWQKKDPRFSYLKTENKGVSAARNFGIQKALGEWILPLDGDDKIGNNYLALASKQFDKNFEIIYCSAELFGVETCSWNLQDYSYEKMLVKNHIFCSGFFKKESWKEVGGYDSSFVYGHEDWDFWLSVLTPKSKVLKLDYIGFFYRRKMVSRDTLLNDSLEKQNIVEKQIYTKHLEKYLHFDKNPLKNYTIENRNNNKFSQLKTEINKNIVTRFLYKIIELF